MQSELIISYYSSLEQNINSNILVLNPLVVQWICCIKKYFVSVGCLMHPKKS